MSTTMNSTMSPAGDAPEIEGIEFGEVYAEIQEGLGEAALIEALAIAASMHKRSAWWLGDLLAYGERVTTYDVLAKATGYHSGSLRRMSSVSKRVPPEVREPTLHWRHHREVAAIGDPEQQRSWLAFAKVKELSSDDLARAIRADADSGASDEDPVGNSHVCPHCHGTGILDGGTS